MKITFQELLSDKKWLHAELLNSIPLDLVDKASKDMYYDVKLIVNGVELEPELYNKILQNVESYINDQAKQLVIEKLENAETKIQKLTQLLETTVENIKEEFDIS